MNVQKHLDKEEVTVPSKLGFEARINNQQTKGQRRDVKSHIKDTYKFHAFQKMI